MASITTRKNGSRFITFVDADGRSQTITLGKVAMRYVALALLGVCAAKALFFDLAELAMAWRIGSFLALGLVLLGVAAAYGGIALRAKEANRRLEDADSNTDPLG